MGCGKGSVGSGAIDFGSLQAANEETDTLLTELAEAFLGGATDPAPLLAEVEGLRADCTCEESAGAIVALNISAKALVVEYTDCKAKLDLILPAVEKWIATSGDIFAKSCASQQTAEAKATFSDFVKEDVEDVNETLEDLIPIIDILSNNISTITYNDGKDKLDNIKDLLEEKTEPSQGIDDIDDILDDINIDDILEDINIDDILDDIKDLLEKKTEASLEDINDILDDIKDIITDDIKDKITDDIKDLLEGKIIAPKDILKIKEDIHRLVILDRSRQPKLEEIKKMILGVKAEMTLVNDVLLNRLPRKACDDTEVLDGCN